MWIISRFVTQLCVFFLFVKMDARIEGKLTTISDCVVVFLVTVFVQSRDIQVTMYKNNHILFFVADWNIFFSLHDWRMLDDHLLKVNGWMPSTFTVWLATFFTFVAICVFSKKRLAFIEHCNSIPGPPAPIPLLGNALELMRDPDGNNNRLQEKLTKRASSNANKLILNMKGVISLSKTTTDWTGN